jgi:hypothetical protein
MRKPLFLLFFLSIFSVKVGAQERKHFTFKEIPIDGSIANFVKELEKQNFKLEDITDVDAVLTGRFTGELVQIVVQGKKETVGSVNVIFPLRESWPATKERYDYIKSNLIEKYGEPKIVTEKFDEPYSEGLGNEKQALKEGKCVYQCDFTTKVGEGIITLKIYVDMSIILVYVDTANYIKLRDEARKEY